MEQQYYNIGKLVATFGVQGQLILVHALGKKTSLKGLQVIMVELTKNDLIPYFVTETKLKTDTEVYITLEGITTKEMAKKLMPRYVWLKEEDFKKYVAKDGHLSLLGYMVYDNDKMLSTITEVIEQPHQILAKIIYNNNEVLIPIHEAFIIRIDNKAKQVVLNLPEGLLEVYC